VVATEESRACGRAHILWISCEQLKVRDACYRRGWTVVAAEEELYLLWNIPLLQIVWNMCGAFPCHRT
jgi:hypothetical protein